MIVLDHDPAPSGPQTAQRRPENACLGAVAKEVERVGRHQAIERTAWERPGEVGQHGLAAGRPAEFLHVFTEVPERRFVAIETHDEATGSEQVGQDGAEDPIAAAKVEPASARGWSAGRQQCDRLAEAALVTAVPSALIERNGQPRLPWSVARPVWVSEVADEWLYLIRPHVDPTAWQEGRAHDRDSSVGYTAGARRGGRRLHR
jgi:hypothetical protein